MPISSRTSQKTKKKAFFHGHGWKMTLGKEKTTRKLRSGNSESNKNNFMHTSYISRFGAANWALSEAVWRLQTDSCLINITHKYTSNGPLSRRPFPRFSAVFWPKKGSFEFVWWARDGREIWNFEKRKTKKFMTRCFFGHKHRTWRSAGNAEIRVNWWEWMSEFFGVCDCFRGVNMYPNYQENRR